MNFLTKGGCFARYNRITHAAVPSDYRGVLADPPTYTAEPVKPPRRPSGERGGNLRVISGPAFTTQIRWCCNNRPPLNRDLEYPNYDYYRKDEYRDPSAAGPAETKPGVAYATSCLGMVGSMYAAKTLATIFISSMAASADVLALASVEVSLADVEVGRTITVKWRGKPLFIKHRSHSEIDNMINTPANMLRDPETDEARAQKPEWLIVIGICTHLGCVPIPNSGDFPGGFYCPCHGSHYDAAGRIRKGPAPLNLVLPPYKFMDDTTVVVG